MEMPTRSVRAPHAMVASADQLATQAGLTAIALGGGAVDAAIATNAAIAVTAPHLCGMGGDLFALVLDGERVHALDASGRAGTGASAAALRADGLTEVPLRHDIRAVTVPGCVDGWVALHERFGRLPLATTLAPAIELAEHGFPASPLLVASLALLDDRGRTSLAELASQATGAGVRVRRPGVGRALRAVAVGGRDAFYGGDFGRGLLELGDGWFAPDDLSVPGAAWVEPLRVDAWGVELWTVPPPSQGYLLLAAAGLLADIDLPDPDDDMWPHLLIEACTAAGHDRVSVLHDRADGAALIAAAADRGGSISQERSSQRSVPGRDGDTTYLCTADRDGMAVSLIQSNASGFGSWLVEPSTGINLHDRGLGFSVEEGHPAELAPGRKPPHTLSPALATRDGALAAVLGTMGGDAQPQILLQLAARLFAHGQRPGPAIGAPRFALHGPSTGFDTWRDPAQVAVAVEGSAPDGWLDGLVGRGHRASSLPALHPSFGHAHAILRTDDGGWIGAADPRAVVGSVAGV